MNDKESNWSWLPTLPGALLVVSLVSLIMLLIYMYREIMGIS